MRLAALLEGDVRPERIVATSFTQKAAAELQERVRVKLLESGHTAAANALSGALIGTVHSLGIRLLQRFAFEAGVSPLVEVIDEADGQRLFNESMAQILTPERIERMNGLSERLGLTKSSYQEPYDWRAEVRAITDIARANNFSQDILERSKERSWETIRALLPEPIQRDDQTWNNRLLGLLDQTIADLEAQTTDQTKVTRDAVEGYRMAHTQLRARGHLHWHEWVKIGKIKPSVRSAHLCEPLQDLARAVEQHQGLQGDMHHFIERLFDTASAALSEFQVYKKQRGLIDYTDMEAYVSQLLRLPDVREALGQEIDLLLVDEFQDTSPIQLDIFLQLSRLARHAIWVGDPKQSIYGFRGAEPALMQAIVEATGGVRPDNILRQSWRSRPDLVYAVNAMFTRAFPHVPPDLVALEPAFTRAEEAAKAMDMRVELPLALQHWHIKNQDDPRKAPNAWFQRAVAEQIYRMLEQGWPVFDRRRKTVRPMQPGDVAVLCRSNIYCTEMAEALHQAGMKAAIARSGLLSTPEVRLVMSCLQYLINPTDALSAAEILILSGSADLPALVSDRLQWLEEQSTARGAGWASQQPLLDALNLLRPQTIRRSASEMLNTLLESLDLRRVCAAMGDAPRRLNNVDALRKLAVDYELACMRLHAAASIGGYLMWLHDLAARKADAQAFSNSADAVQVLTYHKSKGLEYPVTICMNLDQGLRERIWGVSLVSDAPPQLDNILANRWIRYWVNPFADQIRGTRLQAALEASDTYAQARLQALEEEARLLYVGLTRARDYLVMPTSVKGAAWLNRVVHAGEDQVPVLDPNQSELPLEWNGVWLNVQTDVVDLPVDLPARPPADAPHHMPPLPGASSTEPRAPWRIDHLSELPGPLLRLGHSTIFAPALQPGVEAVAAVYTVLKHCFRSPVANLADAVAAQCCLFPAAEALDHLEMVRQAEAFRRWVADAYPGARYLPDCSIDIRTGQRGAVPRVDLLLLCDTRRALVFFAAPGTDASASQQPALHSATWVAWHIRRQPNFKPFQTWIVAPLEGCAYEVR